MDTPTRAADAIGMDANPDTALTALMATGMGRWDASTELFANGLRPSRLEGVPDAIVRPYPNDMEAIFAYSKLDMVNTPGATAFLNAYLEDRSISGDLDLKFHALLTPFPNGVKVSGWAAFSKCESLASIGDGIAVARGLNLEGCSNLASLPKGMVIGTWLDLRRCSAWDDRIPDDAVIEGTIYTDTHTDGVFLDEWRSLHPKGERHPNHDTGQADPMARPADGHQQDGRASA
jgi:hypothetical protein